ncbi:glycoprotein Xg isoform X2 [Psammomys obesus]|uniref:glycoprotein Xg isoform X2 n=1 Tax=Psammomys obesus TaxID=48139 RepID=UPI00245300A1|nr:glycoprotein Xg isoform X2 [Psammomys obesus]
MTETETSTSPTPWRTLILRQQLQVAASTQSFRRTRYWEMEEISTRNPGHVHVHSHAHSHAHIPGMQMAPSEEVEAMVEEEE